MSVFDLYYKNAVKHDWDAHRRRLYEAPAPMPPPDPMAAAPMGAGPPPAGPDNESLIQRYNEIWSPAVEFIQGKLNDMPVEAEDTNDKLFLEALLGVLLGNKLSSEQAAATDAATLRQKVDSLVSKLDGMREDSTNSEVSSYLDTLTSGMSSFRNSVDVGTEAAPAPAGAAAVDPAAATAPDADPDAAPADADTPEDAGGEKPEAEEAPPDQNSPSSLLTDLNLDL